MTENEPRVDRDSSLALTRAPVGRRAGGPRWDSRDGGRGAVPRGAAAGRERAGPWAGSRSQPSQLPELAAAGGGSPSSWPPPSRCWLR